MSELPDGWFMSTLGEVCEKPQYGWTTSAAKIGRIKLLRTTDLSKGPVNWGSVPFCSETPANLNQYLVRDDDIFISRAGSVGFSAHVKEAPVDSVFASYLIRIRSLASILPEYLALFLQSPIYWEQVSEASAGIALANINAVKIKNIRLPLPPLEAQQQIVETLEVHLSRLENAEQALSVAHIESDSLIRSWLHAAFHPRLKNGEVALLGDLAQTRLGKMLDAAKNQGELTSYLRNANVQWERFDLGDVLRARMTEKDRSELMLTHGDVLVCEGGVPGRSAVWESEFFAEESIGFQKALHRVRVGEKLLPKFVVMALRYLSATDQLTEFTTGTTIKHLPQEQLRRLPIPIFSIKEQSDLIFEYEHLQELIAHATTTVEQLRNQLSELRRSLLQAAFNGQLTYARTK